jgi:hypothetical protein
VAAALGLLRWSGADSATPKHLPIIEVAALRIFSGRRDAVSGMPWPHAGSRRPPLAPGGVLLQRPQRGLKSNNDKAFCVADFSQRESPLRRRTRNALLSRTELGAWLRRAISDARLLLTGAVIRASFAAFHSSALLQSHHLKKQCSSYVVLELTLVSSRSNVGGST